MVRKRGGFTLILDYQLYPFGFRTIAKKIQAELGLPVDSPRSLSDQTAKRFLDWHQRRRRIDRIHTYLKDKLPGAQNWWRPLHQKKGVILSKAEVETEWVGQGRAVRAAMLKLPGAQIGGAHLRAATVFGLFRGRF